MTGERGLTRRMLLRAAASAGALSALAAGGLSGCTSTAPGSVQRRPAAADGPVGGDVDLVETAVRSEDELLAFLGDAVARHPLLATQLAPLQERQGAHVTALRRAVEPAVGAGGSVAVGPAVPRLQAAVQPLVVELVEATRRQRLADCLAAESGALARLLASISASHAVTLDGLARHR